MASLIERSTLVWRAVSPEASGGPSGSSLTLRLLLPSTGVMVRTVRRRPPRNQTPVRTGVSSVADLGLVGGVVVTTVRARGRCAGWLDHTPGADDDPRAVRGQARRAALRGPRPPGDRAPPPGHRG